MKNIGVFNAAKDASSSGFKGLKAVRWNFEAPALYEEALKRGEAMLVKGGALRVDTGVFTGRSPKDKFVVRDAMTESSVWWDNNGAISPGQFDVLLADVMAHAAGKELFAQDLYGGADAAYRVRTRVYTEMAWHSLFIRNMLIRPALEELAGFDPEMTIIDLPSFKADPKRHGCRSETVIACDFSRKIVLIGGTEYAGEMKKSVFTYLNYVLPKMKVMPMHCSANVGKAGDVAVFFGLSGTGKTTLIPTGRCWVTMSTAGHPPVSSTLKVAATPRPSASRPKPSPRSTPRRSVLARFSRMSPSIR
jgi:phosphoenolpyruvate carboxykinase (ATP)